MSDCIFCKIAGGEIPSITLFEDDKVKVIFDAGPATVGHALVIPKSHAANVFEIDDELLAHAHIVAKKVATALKEATGCEGVNILQNRVQPFIEFAQCLASISPDLEFGHHFF